ncbi:MAG: sugar phosphate isomerase/epimerase [Bacillota bacterium]|nr:sugar phosphate isomerase/epimerase [Bacillota bacterium]
MDIRWGIQLYSVRKEAEQDLSGTLAKLAGIGYEAVEFHQYYGKPASELRAVLDRCRITPLSGMASWSALQEGLDSVIRYQLDLGSHFLVCPSAPLESLADYFNAAVFLNQVGRTCREQGITFCYHHHEHEFVRFNSVYGLDILCDKTNPDWVKLELDTGNLMFAGIEPYGYFAKHANRCPILHLKDHLPGQIRGSTDLGSGQLELTRLIHAAIVAGTDWLVYEQEHSTDSFASARIALNIMTAAIRNESGMLDAR